MFLEASRPGLEKPKISKLATMHYQVALVYSIFCNMHKSSACACGQEGRGRGWQKLGAMEVVRQKAPWGAQNECLPLWGIGCLLSYKKSEKLLAFLPQQLKEPGDSS